MKPIPLHDVIDRLKAIAANCQFHHNDFAYPFEVVALTKKDVSEIIFKKGARTDNVLGVIMAQKKWRSTQPDFRDWIDKQDWVFRWTAVNNSKPILCLDTRNESKSALDDRTNTRFLLIQWGHDNFIGLKTTVNYSTGF